MANLNLKSVLREIRQQAGPLVALSPLDPAILVKSVRAIRAAHRARKRPTWLTVNQFCATGAGGGVDPTCSSGESKGPAVGTVEWDIDHAKKIAPNGIERTRAKNPLAGDPEFRKRLISGLEVTNKVPNTDSISATFDDQTTTELGVREVPMTAFDDVGDYRAADDNAKVDRLVTKIKENGWISPLIVVADHETRKTGKMYVLEGGHRIRALQKLGVKSIPALVVVDHTEPTPTTNASNAGRDISLNCGGKGGKPGPCPDPSSRESNGSGTIKDKNGVSYPVEFDAGNRTYSIGVPGKESLLTRGVRAGSAQMKRDGTGVSALGIYPEFRRNGLATALYAHIEKHIGKPLQQNWATTEDGAAFWKSRNRTTTNAAGRGQFSSQRNPWRVTIRRLAPYLLDLMPDLTKGQAEGIARSIQLGLRSDAPDSEVAAMIEQYDIDPPRSTLIARTEMARARADTELGRLKPNERVVYVLADGACPKCVKVERKLKGRKLTAKQAEGVIPVHPNCYCRWKVVNRKSGREIVRNDADGFEEVRNDVLEYSRLVDNVFCATGEGGGVVNCGGPGSGKPGPCPEGSRVWDENEVERVVKDLPNYRQRPDSRGGYQHYARYRLPGGGKLEVDYASRTKDIHIDWVGDKDGTDILSGTVGLRNLRVLAKILKRDFPEAETISGYRMGGRKSGRPKGVSALLSRFLVNGSMAINSLLEDDDGTSR